MNKDSVTYDDFINIHLVAATVKEAKRLPDSNKLLRLQVSLENETRQIIAGLGLNYDPEDIVGKQVIIVENLEPKELLGETSQGMLLAGSGESGPVIISPESSLPDGTSIH